MLPVLLPIACQGLGEGYFVSQLKHLKEHYTLDINCVFKADKLIGFSLAYQCTIEGALCDYGLNVSSYAEWDRQVYVLKSMVIEESYQRRGYGTELMKSALNKAKANQLDAIILVGWKSVKGTNIEHLMDDFGFEVICEIQDFWHAESIINQYQCPVCGNPCNCTAIIYSKELKM
ncbi:GNAT family N-acetyltransferase [Carboxylicivirga sediminis]|uniref:GNAT family N-acetyltransferase n=1 Tax=Carboxylicivirga sediminis TaxID=2006564 RepID=A0A941F3R3_9BACT|nr:GNAT family N-acetyltransferase [Carboxylicivirga sediminis]MBR8535817.1 GNAT family N-acetyltransferase [Carboxylicivirga sediminis]